MTLKIAYTREDRPKEIALLTFKTPNEKSLDLDATLTFTEKKYGTNAEKTIKANIINYHTTKFDSLDSHSTVNCRDFAEEFRDYDQHRHKTNFA